MCGIAGLVGRLAQDDSEQRVKRMLDPMKHRGPDDSGFWAATHRDVAFGHLRLSIIDLSAGGHQPKASPDGRLVITFNGEIYNFWSVRQELEKRGHSFSSKSDTEVVLAAYQEWGIECLQRFRGMFAFALYDRDADHVVLARDRAGVKPLYYHRTAGGLAFSSELRALQTLQSFEPRLDADAIQSYLQFGRVVNPSSIYTSARAVKPGHYMTVSLDGEIDEICYWDAATVFNQLDSASVDSSRSIDEYAEELAVVLGESFSLRMVADVPVGVFLSGGVDSTLLTSVLAAKEGANLNTYTIGFDDKDFDEAPQARQIAKYLGTHHTEEYIDDASVFDSVEHIFEKIDEPIGDNSIIPTYLVSKIARKSVKVALSADGGDELFAGYSRFRFFDSYLRYRRRYGGVTNLAGGILKRISPRVLSKIYGLVAGKDSKPAAFEDKILKMRRVFGQANLLQAYDGLTSEWFGADLARVFPRANTGTVNGANYQSLASDMDPIQVLMYTDFTGYMVDDVLTKVDRASMAVSLEAREPFLDNKLIELAARIPVRYKLNNGITKVILRKLLGEYVPDHLIQAKKQGFAMPVGRWMKGPLKPLLKDVLSNASLAAGGIFDAKAVDSFVSQFMVGKNVSSQQIWYLMQFEMWRRQNCPTYEV